ncbi:CAAX protease self-immunity family protein [Bacillus pseudomycoides]|uniref:CPBP family intramembrane glutamic endopeptidase n=1 Tax=Bacillus TaxID=1386 RepID=UPI00036176DA|nr:MULTISPECIES: CPBP family intramembrane glutamic endopeptidase [Bacillus]AIK38325.1 CAAX protease self-immunity family protein [Bacillus pseudomycoides]AJI17798.1 CAAX protease self-immunity family protein [Bacillus pseudomycoides]MEB3055375.1 CPBP family intramembrane glutamic endopeptidase [Bacillus pseudomycoides]PGE97318.1 CPBP family intramembrane metalloprotease [Bacillus pseudomycoides]PHB23888.1 CPBP family intramembrane metalloprotease [Bacillus pseudomycoides]
MQSTTQLTYGPKQSMSWLQFFGSSLFAFFGTGLLSGLFILLPLTIYSEGITNKKTIALYESLGNTASTLLQLLVLLLFIYKYEPVKKLLSSAFNFRALKKVSTYVYLTLFFALNIVLNSLISTHLFPDATTQQASALNLDVLKQYRILLIIGSAIFIPIFEEIIFRGIILRFFSERFPFWIAAIGTSLIFGVAHTYSLGVMLITFLMGLLMAILCKRTNSILPAMLFHIMNNTLAFL